MHNNEKKLKKISRNKAQLSEKKEYYVNNIKNIVSEIKNDSRPTEKNEQDSTAPANKLIAPALVNLFIRHFGASPMAFLPGMLPGVLNASPGNTNGISDGELVNSLLEFISDSALNEIASGLGVSSPIAKKLRLKYEGLTKTGKDYEKAYSELKQMIETDNNLGLSFYEVLCRYLDKSRFETNADFYNYIHIPRQTFNRLKNPKNKPNKENVFLMILGLELDYFDASFLLNSAEYVFRRTGALDMVILYCIKNGIYDIYFINDLLYDLGLPPFWRVNEDKTEDGNDNPENTTAPGP